MKPMLFDTRHQFDEFSIFTPFFFLHFTHFNRSKGSNRIYLWSFDLIRKRNNPPALDSIKDEIPSRSIVFLPFLFHRSLTQTKFNIDLVTNLFRFGFFFSLKGSLEAIEVQQNCSITRIFTHDAIEILINEKKKKNEKTSRNRRI